MGVAGIFRFRLRNTGIICILCLPIKISMTYVNQIIQLDSIYFEAENPFDISFFTYFRLSLSQSTFMALTSKQLGFTIITF